MREVLHMVVEVDTSEIGRFSGNVEREAEVLYEVYRRAKPTAVGGAVIPSWKENSKEDVKDAWRAVAAVVIARLPPKVIEAE